MANTNRTFEELQQAIETDMQLDPGLISATERKQFINDALRDLSTMDLFEYKVEIPITEGVGTLPDDFISPNMLVWKETSTSMKPTYLRPELHNSISGSSSMYVIIGDELITYPKATGTVTMYYMRRLPKLINPSDKPAIPNGWDKILVDYAIGHCHRKNGQIGLYREYVAAFQSEKNKLREDLTKKQNSRVTRTVSQDGFNGMTTPFDYL